MNDTERDIMLVAILIVLCVIFLVLVGYLLDCSYECKLKRSERVYEQCLSLETHDNEYCEELALRLK